MGICQPLDVKGYVVYSDYPALIKNKPQWVDSLQELDSDTTDMALFHDKANGKLPMS